MPVIDRPLLLEHLIAIELVAQNRGGHVAPKDACLSGNPARRQAAGTPAGGHSNTRPASFRLARHPARPFRNGPTLLSLGISLVQCANSRSRAGYEGRVGTAQLRLCLDLRPRIHHQNQENLPILPCEVMGFSFGDPIASVLYHWLPRCHQIRMCAHLCTVTRHMHKKRRRA